MSEPTAPRMSFVVATDTLATVADVLASLRAQPDPEGIEVVLACPSAAALGEGQPLPGPLRIVEVAGLAPIHEAFAAGIREATAPVVLVGETHAFPEPGALEPLVRAICDEGYAAVAPGLRNANPETPESWASLMVTYGWTLGLGRRETRELSTHNTAYNRDLLLAFGDELPALLRLGGGIHARLRAQGHRLLVEPASVFAHQNVVRLRSIVGDRFHAARCYTSARSESWSKGRRAIYAVASPLIPIVMGIRVVRSPGWKAHRSEFTGNMLPPLVVNLAAHGAGELAAYVSGVGNSTGRIVEYEVHRARHL